MRPAFTLSAETKALVSLFEQVPINQLMTFGEASKRVGFDVHSTLPAYHSARRIATRDHGIIIEAVPRQGFVRLDGSGMVKRGGKFLDGIRRKARRGASEMSVAVKQNLTRNEMLDATERLSRFRIIGDTASVPKTNRGTRHEPEIAEHHVSQLFQRKLKDARQ